MSNSPKGSSSTTSSPFLEEEILAKDDEIKSLRGKMNLCMKTFTLHKTQVRVHLLMDNVTYINKMRGTRSSVISNLATVDLDSSTSIHYCGKTYSREPKPRGGLGVTHCCRPLRLETQTRDISTHSETLGSPGNSSLRIPPVVPDPQVRKLEAS